MKKLSTNKSLKFLSLILLLNFLSFEVYSMDDGAGVGPMDEPQAPQAGTNSDQEQAPQEQEYESVYPMRELEELEREIDQREEQSQAPQAGAEPQPQYPQSAAWQAAQEGSVRSRGRGRTRGRGRSPMSRGRGRGRSMRAYGRGMARGRGQAPQTGTEYQALSREAAKSRKRQELMRQMRARGGRGRARGIPRGRGEVRTFSRGASFGGRITFGPGGRIQGPTRIQGVTIGSGRGSRFVAEPGGSFELGSGVTVGHMPGGFVLSPARPRDARVIQVQQLKRLYHTVDQRLERMNEDGILDLTDLELTNKLFVQVVRHLQRKSKAQQIKVLDLRDNNFEQTIASEQLFPLFQNLTEVHTGQRGEE